MGEGFFTFDIPKDTISFLSTIAFVANYEDI
jgi:hypothetical protein